MGAKHSKPSAIILAAGKGTRMGGDLPKVAHHVGGRPMVCAVVDACLKAGCRRIVVVVGYRQQIVRDALAGYEDRVEFALQAEQQGTGHAVLCAREALLGGRGRAAQETFVLAGDGPLVRHETLSIMRERHMAMEAVATLATSEIDDPEGYGRIIRDIDGAFVGIVEQKNLSPEQIGIREINPSYYLFGTQGLFDALDRVERNGVSGEYYVTDVPGLMRTDGGWVEVVRAVPAEDVLSINTPEQLAEVDRIYQERVANEQAERAER